MYHCSVIHPTYSTSITAIDRGVDSQLQSSAVSILTKEIERARQGKDVRLHLLSLRLARIACCHSTPQSHGY